MQKEEFTQLKLEEKVEFVWNEAELISQKVYYDCDISLFLLENYYVEVFFNRVANEVMSIEIQNNSQILYGYVKDLNIQEIVQRLY